VPKVPAVPGLLAVLLILAALAGCGGDGSGDGDGGTGGADDRQAEVAERGASVMPFDLDATTHRFESRDDGLVQTVVADDATDGDQVALVRGHLADEAGRFAAGDFGDPAAIHGDDMPGLAALAAGAARVDVAYADVPGGARITFSTGDPDLVDALHRWGEAQVGDHGDHAEHVEHRGDADDVRP
jgi:hypothetical protein